MTGDRKIIRAVGPYWNGEDYDRIPRESWKKGLMECQLVDQTGKPIVLSHCGQSDILIEPAMLKWILKRLNPRRRGNK